MGSHAAEKEVDCISVKGGILRLKEYKTYTGREIGGAYLDRRRGVLGCRCRSLFGSRSPPVLLGPGPVGGAPHTCFPAAGTLHATTLPFAGLAHGRFRPVGRLRGRLSPTIPGRPLCRQPRPGPPPFPAARAGPGTPAQARALRRGALPGRQACALRPTDFLALYAVSSIASRPYFCPVFGLHTAPRRRLRLSPRAPGLADMALLFGFVMECARLPPRRLSPDSVG